MSLLNEDNIYEETRKATRPPMTYTAFKNLLSIVKKTPESTQEKINIEKYIDTDKSDGITINNKGDISFHGRKGLELAKKLKEENLPTTNIFKQRENKNMGGILQDDNSRIGYAEGPSEEEVEQLETRKHLKNVLGDKTANTLLTADRDSPEFKQAFDKAVVEEGMGPDGLEFELNKLRGETPAIPKDDNRIIRAEGGSLLQDDMAMLEEDIPMEETHMMPDGTEMPGATHEESEMMMESVEPEMDPDSEMEKEFLDFIIDEALSEEEEDMLMSKLEQDDQLSILFDKVIDVAQEFAGSGPVEGPGSGVSDSIPARLSDGEFVFTAAAVEEIGADNLMAMMKDAEMKAEERQGLAEGGELEERVELPVKEQKEPQVRIVKKTVDSSRGVIDEDEVSKGIKSKMMLDPDQRHVRS